MSQSFYKYLVESILRPFFEGSQILSRNKYYLILENKDQRQALLDAMRNSSYAVPCRLDRVSSNSLLDEFATPYDTICLQFPGATSIIVGDSDSANEDYLTTLRNAVCEDGNPLSNNGLLLILSNNRMESLTTACADLQSRELPFSPSAINKSILQKVSETFDNNEYEKVYIESYLTRITGSIAEGIGSLADYEDVMNVLAKNSLADHFNDLGFFRDKKIYNHSFKLDHKALQQRIEDNAIKYLQIRNTMSDDADVVEEQLSRFLDDILAEDIARGKKDWQELDYEDIKRSVERRNATEKLLVDKIEFGVSTDTPFDILYCEQRKGTDSKTTRSIIVCDPENHDELFCHLAFNKEIQSECLSINVVGAKKTGRHLYVPLSDDVVRITAGRDSNKHVFNIIRIAASKQTFERIQGIFSVTAKGNIEVHVPDDDDVVVIGYGENLVKGEEAALSWGETDRLEIKVEESEEGKKQEVKIAFKNKPVTVTLKLNQDRVVPWSATKIFETIWRDHVTFQGVPSSAFENTIEFRRVRSENDDCSVVSIFSLWLRREWQMITRKTPLLRLQTDDNHEYENDEPIEYPTSVKDALNAIFDYFESNRTVPSLAYIDDTLRRLYEVYVKSVIEIIEAQPGNKTLPEVVENLKRLGVLELSDGKIALTPFHPLMVAYMLEFADQFDNIDYQPDTLKLITPYYLVPFMYYLQRQYRPYVDSETEVLKTWQLYEPVSSSPQQHSCRIVTKMVVSKLDQFLKHFDYLFPDKECPIKISVIGIRDDEAVIKGIIEFLCVQAEGDNDVQRIEIHEYVDDLLHESFYERLNRLGTFELIAKELNRLNLTYKKNEAYTEYDIIRLLFTRVVFYKHALSSCNNQIQYCHITFYQINTGDNFIVVPTDELRFELPMHGLISMPSTVCRDKEYKIGFGTRDMIVKDNSLYHVVKGYNALYADNGGMYMRDACLAKRYSFSQSELLSSIYENSNWVTFLNPEVDIDFFYKQDVYIIHYTDQETINARYDSITVTKHVEQYNQMLRQAYNAAMSYDNADVSIFIKRMKEYFNCLNGDWLLSIINKTEAQINEKLSIVATCIGMLRFMSRVEGVVWIPISLDAILRVTGNVGLPKDSIFSKKTLGIKGVMSDDLLMFGLDVRDQGNLKVYFYPIEVKLSDNSSLASKGLDQVCKTYQILREKLCDVSSFTKNIYRTLFISQFLSNADKLHANDLIDESDYEAIQRNRFKLLNLLCEIESHLPNDDMGHGALVSYYGTTSRTLKLVKSESNINICEIFMPKDDCYKCVTRISEGLDAFLSEHSINVAHTMTEISEQPLPNHKEPQAIAGPIVKEEGGGAEDVVPSTITIDPHSEQLESPRSSLSEDTSISLVSKPMKKGVMLRIGTRKGENASDIYFEPTNTNKITHPNMGIIGTMGTGKTQFAKSLIAQLSREWENNVRQRPIGVLVFDYKGDYNDPAFVAQVHGECYKSRYPFNPLKLLRTSETDGLNLPSITADRIADSLQKAFNLGIVQRNNIKQIIVGVYSDFGITRDPATWDSPAPTMRDVIDRYLEEHDANDSVFAIFSTLNDYSLFAENNDDCVSLFEWLDGVKVIDLTLYEDNTKKLIGSLILDIFYAEMKQLGESATDEGFRQLRAMIMVDEAHQFLKARFNSLRKIISEGRMFGVGMILSTQNIGDFKTAEEDFTQYIMSWVLHHVPNITKSELERVFGSNNAQLQNYMRYINQAGKFESLVKLGGTVTAIKDLPYYKLLDIDARFKEIAINDKQN